MSLEPHCRFLAQAILTPDPPFFLSGPFLGPSEAPFLCRGLDPGPGPAST